MREQKNKKKTVSVRRQKVRKNHVREKLIFFAILALLLLMAKVCQISQRADAFAEGGTVSDGGKAVRKQYI